MGTISTATLRALIVDANMHTAKLVRSLLLECGIKEITVVQTVPDVLHHLSARRVDIVLCNWVSGNLPALSLLKCVRSPKVSHDCRVPVIMIVSQPSVEQITTARDFGATEFLAMPLSKKAVERVLAHSLTRPRDFILDPTYIGPDRRRRKLEVGKERRRAQAKAAGVKKETEKA